MITLYVTYKFFEFMFKGLVLLCAMVAGAMYGAFVDIRSKCGVR